MYALIEPVVAKSFQKNSAVRIGRKYPFFKTFRALFKATRERSIAPVKTVAKS